MLITVNNVVLNVTAIVKIVLDSEEEVTYEKVNFFKRKRKVKTTFFVELFYKDVDGRAAKFKWGGGESAAIAEGVQREILNQVREVELEHMTSTLEDAMRKN